MARLGRSADGLRRQGAMIQVHEMVRRWWRALMLVAVSGGLAAADEGTPAGLDHRGQVGFHLQVGTGYRALVPYDDEYCGDVEETRENRAVCLGRSRLGLDVGLSYGLRSRLELFAEARLGLERDVGERPGESGPRAVAVGLGVKGYLVDIGPAMLFATLQVPVDFTGYDQFDKVDIGVRNVNGLQFDLHKSFGLYGFIGEQVSGRRWLRFELEAGFGGQVRFP